MKATTEMIKYLKKEMGGMKKENESLKSKHKDNDENKENKQRTDGQTIKGYDSKNLDKTEQYDCDFSKFEKWNTVFKAMMTSYATRWDPIFTNNEIQGRKIIGNEDNKRIEDELQMDDQMSKSVKTTLKNAQRSN